MIEDMLWACAFMCSPACFFTITSCRALKRFDQKNVARIAPAGSRPGWTPTPISATPWMWPSEQVEEVQEIKVAGGTHYLFEAQVFATRDEAEEMRARRVGVVARRFYEELPTALSTPVRKARSPLSARERASKRWKRTIH
jgi:hypothetical protein